MLKKHVRQKTEEVPLTILLKESTRAFDVFSLSGLAFLEVFLSSEDSSSPTKTYLKFNDKNRGECGVSKIL